MIHDITAGYLVTVVVVLVISITLHEAMHAFAGFWLGDDTAQREGRLTLNPLRHVDPYMTLLLPVVSVALFGVPVMAAKPVPFNPNRVRHDEYGAAMVGLAGPLANLVLAIAGASLLHLLTGTVAASFLLTFTQINVWLFVFNMFPIPPLDGSRLIYALVPEPVQDFMASMERYGIMLIFALVLLVPAFGTLLVAINQAILSRLI